MSERAVRQGTDDTYVRDGGEGLPPARFSDDDDASTWLFTCCSCGRRWVSPLGVITKCGCGGDVVAHQFETDDYRRIRWYDDPRDPRDHPEGRGEDDE